MTLPTLLAALCLARSNGVGAKKFRELLAKHGDYATAYRSLPAPDRADEAACATELATLQNNGGGLLVWGQPDYPARLAGCADAPAVISYFGNPRWLQPNAIALVGARQASAAGRKLAETIAADLSQRGYVIISGLARGIDGLAHHAALKGGTIAVLGCGVDVIYPSENDTLYSLVREHGLLLSELPLGTKPQAQNFPRRNRIIAGLAQATVVVEAAVKSGSLITARYASSYHRPVLAVPGSPLDTRFGGTNALIKSGARLVENAADIEQALQDAPAPSLFEDTTEIIDPDSDTDSDTATSLLEMLEDLLSSTLVALDDLIRYSGASAAAVNASLTTLELMGKCERLGGQKVVRRIV